MLKKLLCVITALIVILGAVPFSASAREYEHQNIYPDYNPGANATYQDFVAMVLILSWFGTDEKPKDSGSILDAKGNPPASYALGAVNTSAARGYFIQKPSAWTDPVTREWAARFVCHMRGNYTYNLINVYPYEDTYGMTAVDRMYLTRAIELGFLKEKSSSSADPKGYITRGETVRITDIINERYRTPFVDPAFVPHPNGVKPKVHAYYTEATVDNPDPKQFDNTDVDMLTFFVGNATLSVLMDLGSSEDTSILSYRLDKYGAALEAANKNGIEVYLPIASWMNTEATINKLTAIIDDASQMKILANDFVTICKRDGFAGVNLGLEFVNITMEQHNKLAAALSTALHAAGLKLIVTVGAVNNDDDMKKSFYDYYTLGPLADYIHILTYDDTSISGYARTGVPGSLSNYTRMGRIIEYALYTMPAEKILVGFGSYAIDYTVGTRNAENISISEMNSRVKNSKTTPVHGIKNDYGEDCPYVEYTDSEGIKHVVTYEDKASLKKRFQLVYDYGLGGASYYAFKFENPDFIPALKGVYNTKSYVKPVTEASSWAQGELTKAINAGLVPEYIQNNYKQNITRNEFFDILRTMAQKLNLDTSYNPYNTFPDCASPAALWAAKTGITNIAFDKPFSPFRTLTRQEAAVTMTRFAENLLKQNTASPQTSYKDQAQIASWGQIAVNYMGKTGVMAGSAEGFVPNGLLPREQALVIAYRFYESMK